MMEIKIHNSQFTNSQLSIIIGVGLGFVGEIH